MLGLVGDQLRWKAACGPITGTINTLIDAGWKPAAPDRWLSPKGEMALVGATPYANAHVRAEVRSDLEAAAAREASEHAVGEGIGDCVRLGLARAAKRFFLKHRRWRDAAAVDHIVCGTMWDPSPVRRPIPKRGILQQM